MRDKNKANKSPSPKLAMQRKTLATANSYRPRPWPDLGLHHTKDQKSTATNHMTVLIGKPHAREAEHNKIYRYNNRERSRQQI